MFISRILYKQAGFAVPHSSLTIGLVGVGLGLGWVEVGFGLGLGWGWGWVGVKIWVPKKIWVLKKFGSRKNLLKKV